MSTATEPIEQTIRTVATRRLGAVDATIVRVQDRDFDPSIGGVWFTLSIRLPGDTERQPLGRRRTKKELLALVSTIAPQHVGGRNFAEIKPQRPRKKPT